MEEINDPFHVSRTLREAVAAGFVVMAVALPPTTRVRSAIGAVVAAAMAFVWLYPPHSEDWCTYVNVWDCLHFDQCFTVGAGSSVMLANGALWPDLMTLAGRIGPGAALPALLVALTALAVGVVFDAIARFGRPAWAWAVAAGLVLWIAWAIDPVLLDADATFPFAAVGQAALVVFALRGRWEALAAAALLLAVAGNVHTSALTGALALGVVAIAASANPIVGGVIAFGLWLVTTAWTSAGALRDNALLIVTRLPHGLVLAVGGLVGLIGAGLLCRRRWKVSSDAVRMGAVGAAVVLPQLAGVALLLAIGHGLWSRYAMPVAAPAVVAVVAAVDALAARRLPAWARGAALAAPIAWALTMLPAYAGPEGVRCFEVGDPGTPRERFPTDPRARATRLLTDDADNVLKAIEADPSALGPDVSTFGVSELGDDSYIRVGVQHTDGRWTRFTAVRPPLAGPRDEPFLMLSDRGDHDPDVDRYAAFLARRLPRWPWSEGLAEFRWLLPG
ncbi:MAG: hypothetical protein ACRENE_02825, partial [Polyangiaceae bacterium]